MSAYIKINGIKLGAYNGRTYVLDRVIRLWKYDTNGPTITDPNNPMFFTDDEIIFADNETNSDEIFSSLNKGISWVFSVEDSSLPAGKNAKFPTLFNDNKYGFRVVWYVYRPVNHNTDRAVTPPLVNIYNENGRLSYSSLRPSLKIDQFVTVPRYVLQQMSDTYTPNQSWRYNVGENKILLMSSPLATNGENFLTRLINPGKKQDGTLYMGYSTTFGAVPKSIISDKIVIAHKPTASEIRSVPVWDGGSSPVGPY